MKTRGSTLGLLWKLWSLSTGGVSGIPSVAVKCVDIRILDEKESIFNYVAKKDLLLYYPYHSFEHFIHFLYEAVHNPETREIMVTQYLSLIHIFTGAFIFFIFS